MFDDKSNVLFPKTQYAQSEIILVSLQKLSQTRQYLR